MRQGLVLFGIGSLIFAAMIFYLFSGENDRYVSVATPEVFTSRETKKLVRDVTPADILQPPDFDEALLERLPAKKAPLPPARPPRPKPYKRPVIVEAGRLSSSGIEIQLTGIVPVPLDEICKDASGTPWPCGRFARTAFNAFVRGRTVECDPVDEGGQLIATRCFLVKQDMASWLVRSGWAKSASDAYNSDEIAARNGLRGIWRKVRP